MDKIYLQYAELLGAVSTMEVELSEKKRALIEIKEEIDSEEYGLDLTAHASTNINKRICELAMENAIIYEDVFNIKDQSKSLLWPCNLKAFVIGMLASARSKGSFQKKPSKNTQGGNEYHYEVEIKKWSTDKEVLIFTAIVESNMVKTGYFNWEDRK